MPPIMVADLGHAFFNILPELFKINIEVSFDGRELIDDHIFNHLAFESIQLLGRVQVVHSGHLLLKLVHLSLTRIESYLQRYQLLLKVLNRVKHSLLAFHDLRIVTGNDTW
jgi:hypothetical protein